MAAYLTDHPPVRDQWYHRRNRPLTGCTVLHSTESIFDEMGVDTGAENVAEFIRTRSTAGSYHDLVDSDSDIDLVDYVHGAYHDATGSNNWALAIAFACRTVDWRRMTPAKRKAILHRGAVAFARQQAYRRSIGAPLTELRLITKAQSDAGMSGFTYHGFRDPGRRTDPGTKPPDLFPFDEFIEECRAVLPGSIPATEPDEEDDVPLIVQVRGEGGAPGGFFIRDGAGYDWISSMDTVNQLTARGLPLVVVDQTQHGAWVDAQAKRNAAAAAVDPKALGAAVAEALKGVAFPTAEAIAAAFHDDADRRARDGDPATGPVS